MKGLEQMPNSTREEGETARKRAPKESSTTTEGEKEIRVGEKGNDS